MVEILRDDFHTDDLINTSVWNVADRHTASALELSYYMKENVGAKNEYLVLLCEEENFRGCNYTSARVDTNGKFQFLYGEIEWRAKMPRGLDFYTGLWLTKPTKKADTPLPLEFNPPAIAFIDANGVIYPRVFHGRNHLQQVAFETGLYSNHALSKKPLAFHTFRIVWTNTSLEWFVDDHRVFWVHDPAKIPHVPLEIVQNIIVGGVFCEQQTPNASMYFQTRQVLIDYVVVRQNRPFSDNSTDYEAAATAGEPAYFFPVVGILTSVLVVCLLVLAVIGFKRYRSRYQIQPSRF